MICFRPSCTLFTEVNSSLTPQVISSQAPLKNLSLLIRWVQTKISWRPTPIPAETSFVWNIWTPITVSRINLIVSTKSWHQWDQSHPLVALVCTQTTLSSRRWLATCGILRLQVFLTWLNRLVWKQSNICLILHYSINTDWTTYHQPEIDGAIW